MKWESNYNCYETHSLKLQVYVPQFDYQWNEMFVSKLSPLLYATQCKIVQDDYSLKYYHHEKLSALSSYQSLFST